MLASLTKFERVHIFFVAVCLVYWSTDITAVSLHSNPEPVSALHLSQMLARMELNFANTIATYVLYHSSRNPTIFIKLFPLDMDISSAVL